MVVEVRSENVFRLMMDAIREYQDAEDQTLRRSNMALAETLRKASMVLFILRYAGRGKPLRDPEPWT